MNCSCHDDGSGIRSTTTYKLNRRRWLVLVAFSLLSMNSAWIWITFSPIAVSMSEYWNVSLEQVDAIAAIYLYMYVPFSFLSLYLVVNHLGLWRGLLLGGTCNLTGALVRWTYRRNYTAVYVGTLLAAYAQTFTLSTPPLIANRWFGSHERATATALGVLANQLGTAIGLGITAMVDFEIERHDYEDMIPSSTATSAVVTMIDEVRLQHYLLVQAVVAAVALLLVTIFVRDEPPTPPNKAAQASAVTTTTCKCKTMQGMGCVQESTSLLSSTLPKTTTTCNSHKNHRRESYGNSIRQVFGSMSNMSFTCAFGMTVGVFYTIPAFLGQLVSMLPSKYDGDSRNATTKSTTTTAGWLGILYQFGGIVGSLGAGRLVDITQQHRPLYLGLLFLAAVALVILTAGLIVAPTVAFLPRFIGGKSSMGSSSNSIGTITTAAGVLLAGCGLAAVNTVGLDYGTAIMYPADEATVAGVMECAAELFGFVLVTVGGTIMSTTVDAEGKFLCFGLLLIASVWSSFLITHSKDYQVTRPT
jgi:MFS family permease